MIIDKGFRKMTEEERALDYKSSSFAFYISQLISMILLIGYLFVHNTLNDIILAYITIGWTIKLFIQYKDQKKIFQLIESIFLFAFFIIFIIGALKNI